MANYKHKQIALTVAEEYRALRARGDTALADQAERTIDDLVGFFQCTGSMADGTYCSYFCWPDNVAQVAGLSPVRLTRRASAAKTNAYLATIIGFDRAVALARHQAEDPHCTCPDCIVTHFEPVA